MVPVCRAVALAWLDKISLSLVVSRGSASLPSPCDKILSAGEKRKSFPALEDFSIFRNLQHAAGVKLADFIKRKAALSCAICLRQIFTLFPENDEEVAQGSLSLLKVLMKNGIPKVFNQETAEMELSRSNDLYSREKLSLNYDQ